MEYQESLLHAQKLLEMEEVQSAMRKEEEAGQYQKSLLTLYKEHERLKNILKTQDEKMTQEKEAFVRDFQLRLRELEQEKTVEVDELQRKYDEVEGQRQKAELQHQIFNEEEEAEMELYKVRIRQQEEDELTRAEDRKELLLG